MATPERDAGAQPKLQVRLVDVDPDFLRALPEDERQQARDVTLPAIDLPRGNFNPADVLAAAGGWYGMLMEGMVNRSARIGDQVALRVLGPSAAVPAFEGLSSAMFAASQWSMAVEGRMAILGEEFLGAAWRWPQLYINLLERIAEQSEQLVTQLALCQLPRVEDRLLAMLWLLTESWGKVTASGTILPLHFTHEALGAMVGARRSTVTLALAKLSEDGAVVQRDGGWLLIEPPPQQRLELRQVEPPQLLDLGPTAWCDEQGPSIDPSQERVELLALVSRLREEHRRSIGELHERVRRAQGIREQALEIRARLHQERKPGRKPIPPPV